MSSSQSEQAAGQDGGYVIESARSVRTYLLPPLRTQKLVHARPKNKMYGSVSRAGATAENT